MSKMLFQFHADQKFGSLKAWLKLYFSKEPISVSFPKLPYLAGLPDAVLNMKVKKSKNRFSPLPTRRLPRGSIEKKTDCIKFVRPKRFPKLQLMETELNSLK